MKRKFLILICLILFFVSFAGVSASEDVNQTITEDINNVVNNVDTLSVSTVEDVNQTIDDNALGVSEDVNVISAKDDGTFTALQKKINDAGNGTTIKLENDYKYDSGFSTEGITINYKTLTIEGNGHIIDALGQSKIFIIDSSTVTLNNIIFKNGNGSDGGAIDCDFYSNLAVESCTFENNTADYYGGAIDCGSYSVINNCSFINNSATRTLGRGGAIDCGSYSVINNCTFVNNNALGTSSDSGGAIYLDGGDIMVSNCYFLNNYAYSEGGAIDSYWKGNTIENCTFENNCAELGAGAIKFGYGGTIINSKFINNSACGLSGSSVECGDIISKGTVTVINSQFINNPARTLYVLGDAIVVNSQFINNSDNSLTVYGNLITMSSQFINNSGRASYVEGNLSVGSSQFINNSGGALHVRGNLTVVNSQFIENTAEYYSGGALYVEGNLSVGSSQFIKNIATYYGGAIYSNSNLNINDSNFTDNFARNGDAVYHYIENNMTLINSNINYNSIYFTNDLYKDIYSKITLSNLNFSRYNDYEGLISMDENILDIYRGFNSSAELTVNIAGKTFKANFDDDGYALINLQSLTIGTYDAKISYWDNEKSASSQFSLPITIESLTKLDVPDVTKNYGGPESLQITLVEGDEPIANAKVNININGVDYTRTTDANGEASLGLNLNAGSYDATVTYKDISTTAKVVINKLTTKNTLSYAKNSHNSFTLTALIDTSTASGDVVFTVNGKDYPAKVNDGKASYTLNNLAVGSYSAVAKYNGDVNHKESSSNSVKFTVEDVKIDINVPDVTKNYGGPESLQITLVEGDEPIANAKVNININGVDYTRTTDANGEASLGLNLNAGSYDATVAYKDISTMAKVVINKLATKNTLTYNKNSHNSFTLTAIVNPSSASGDVVFTVNSKDYTVKISEGKATYVLSNLDASSYDAKAQYNGEINYKPSTSNTISFTVEEAKYNLSAPDVTKYYHGPERFVVTVKEDNVPVVGKDVTITLNGVPYTRTTDNNGVASMAINLESGVYNVTSEYDGIMAYSKIIVKTTIESSDITKIFRNGTQYYATFRDSNGNLLRNCDVNFNINGVFYTRTTNENGVARMNINLLPKEYVLTAMNPVSGESCGNLITVLPNIVENHDLTKYYKNASKFTFRLLDNQGRPVGAGVSASLNINGVFYTRTTDANGYINMNINLNPGTYIATIMYNGLSLANTIKVLPILEANDVVMKYRDGTKFEAKLLDGQGKPFAGQTLIFNINGVMYNRITGDDGIARLNINLMPGEYIITSMYSNGATIANKVTVRS